MEESNNHAPKQYGFLKGGYYRIEACKWQRSPSIVNGLETAVEQDVASFTFPGHNRGQATPMSLTRLIGEKPFLYDLPELDNLCEPQGPFLDAQNQAAEVFGASKTWFVVGGTTCGIHADAAIMGVSNPGDTLILPRNSHKSATSAMVFGGLIPKNIFPDYDFDWEIPTIISPSQVKKAIEELGVKGIKPAAVLITSPTYQGICSNIHKISTLCHLHNIPLIVDEAHGGHFGFHPSFPSSALQQGADVVVQSTHKALFSLTQSSMLHASNTNIINKDNITKCLQALQTTSPSALLLASLDATTTQLKENTSNTFDNVINLAKEAKNTLKQIHGITVLDYPYMDPLRVTVGVYDLGVSGYEADDFIYMDQKVISELQGSRFITFPFTPGTCKEHVNRLILGFKNLSSFIINQHINQRTTSITTTPSVEFEQWNDIINMKLTPREAFFAKKKKVDIKEAIGKICGEMICPFPPGFPIITLGEVISERVVEILVQSIEDGARIIGTCDPNLSSILICDL